jgi:hypothetical protein
MKIIKETVLFASLLFLWAALSASGRASQQGNEQGSSSAAERLPPTISISKETEFLSCWAKNEDQPKSRLMRSPVLVSPDGLYRAHVEVEATAFKPKDETTYSGPFCYNDSRLFVEGPSGKSFRIIYSDSPKVLEGNSIKLVDWSPDGKTLLVESAQWEYESEGIYTEFFIFSIETGSIVEPDLKKILAARFGKDCYSENTIVGFDSTGAIEVTIEPNADEIGIANGAKSCVKRKTLVAVDISNLSTNSVKTVPANKKILQNGRFLSSEHAK